jgi:uncharacterized membrane protein YedE/YeeE
VNKRGLTAFGAGLLFALGLSLSGMTRPSTVLAFLDVTGHWDPSLAAVMVGAIGVTAIAFQLRARRDAPLFAERFRADVPRKPVDARLVLGAVVFGAGWGLSGLCPGAAVTSLASGQIGVVVFVLAMLAGMAGHRLYQRSSGRTRLAAELLAQPAQPGQRAQPAEDAPDPTEAQAAE